MRHNSNPRSPKERVEPRPASRQPQNESNDKPGSSESGTDPCAPLPTDALEPLQAFFSLFCSRWSLPVLAALAPEEMGCACAEPSQHIEYSKSHSLRRSQLQKRLPHVSTKMLTETLLRLQNAGLVERQEFAQVPTRVEYSITLQGQKFLKPLRALQNWCGQNHDVVSRALERLPE